MSNVRSIAGGLAVFLAAVALGHGGSRAAEPEPKPGAKTEAKAKTYTMKDLQALYIEILTGKGYKAEATIDVGITVRAGGEIYIVLLYEKNPDYFALCIPFQPLAADADPAPILRAGNRVTETHSGVKFFIHTKSRFPVLQSQHDIVGPEAARTVLPLALADLDAARKAYERAIAPKPPAK